MINIKQNFPFIRFKINRLNDECILFSILKISNVLTRIINFTNFKIDSGHV